MIFVDTSALLAALDDTQPEYKRVAAVWRRFKETEESLITSNYVVVEAMAVTQRRLGIPAVRDLNDLISVVDIVWIDREVHERAVAALLAAGKRKLSLVDCTSFEIMRRRGLRTAFTLDRDFSLQGFQRIPRTR